MYSALKKTTFFNIISFLDGYFKPDYLDLESLHIFFATFVFSLRTSDHPCYEMIDLNIYDASSVCVHWSVGLLEVCTL